MARLGQGTQGNSNSTNPPADSTGSVRWAPLDPPPIDATRMLAIASRIWNWCGRLSALDQPSVLRARAVTNHSPSGSRTDLRILVGGWDQSEKKQIRCQTGRVGDE
uniref:Uncharacterized protein n=1 Tax=Anopheles culicifacies TaxID=139723 RepID=A0A182LXW5_9DIPT